MTDGDPTNSLALHRVSGSHRTTITKNFRPKEKNTSLCYFNLFCSRFSTEKLSLHIIFIILQNLLIQKGDYYQIQISVSIFPVVPSLLHFASIFLTVVSPPTTPRSVIVTTFENIRVSEKEITSEAVSVVHSRFIGHICKKKKERCKREPRA